MLDQLVKLVRQNAGDEIINNPAIPDQHNDEAIRDVGTEIYNGFQKEAKQGNVQGVATLFKDEEAAGSGNTPMVASMISNVAAKFASKFGISPDVAAKVAAGVVPKIVKRFTQKAKNPDDNEFDLQDVIKNLTGNSNVGDLIGQFTGGKSGGIGDMAKGFFK